MDIADLVEPQAKKPSAVKRTHRRTNTNTTTKIERMTAKL
jgi:hypothetical protein